MLEPEVGGEAGERDRLVNEILSSERRIYQAISQATTDAWLRVDLTMPQLKVLLVLYFVEAPRRHMTHLASALGVTLPTATGVVDRLVEAGLVQRSDDPTDRRIVVVGLTTAGRELVDRLRATGRHELTAALELLTVAELATVARGLDLLLTASRSRQEQLMAATADLIPTRSPR